MTNFSKENLINLPKAQVWETLANLGDIYRFNPGVSMSYYTSELKKGVNASRICELQPMGKVEEVAVEWDDGTSYTLRVDGLEKTPPVKNFYVGVEIIATRPHQCKVKLTVAYDTKLGVLGKLLNNLMIENQMKLAIQSILDGLKIHLEQGKEIPNNKTLKQFLNVT